jgi:hypothetical protein
MGMISNGRAKYESTFVPGPMAKQQREPARDNDERSQFDNLSEILTRGEPDPRRGSAAQGDGRWHDPGAAGRDQRD